MSDILLSISFSLIAAPVIFLIWEKFFERQARSGHDLTEQR